MSCIQQTLCMDGQIKAEWRISHVNVYVDKTIHKWTLFLHNVVHIDEQEVKQRHQDTCMDAQGASN